MLNDSLVPVPHFEIAVKETEHKTIILVGVKKSKDTPYYYQGKAFKRADTSMVEVDRFELRRLAMEGLNIDDEERKATSQDLSFISLESRLREEAGIESISLDILKTLNLGETSIRFCIEKRSAINLY